MRPLQPGTRCNPGHIAVLPVEVVLKVDALEILSRGAQVAIQIQAFVDDRYCRVKFRQRVADIADADFCSGSKL